MKRLALLIALACAPILAQGFPLGQEITRGSITIYPTWIKTDRGAHPFRVFVSSSDNAVDAFKVTLRYRRSVITMQLTYTGVVYRGVSNCRTTTPPPTVIDFPITNAEILDIFVEAVSFTPVSSEDFHSDL